MTAECDEQLDEIPERDKGESNKETEGAAKVGDQGVKGVDEVFPQHGGAQRPVGEDDPKDVEVSQICCNNPVLVVGAREKTTSMILNKSLIHSCKFEIILFKQVKLVSLRAGSVSCMNIKCSNSHGNKKSTYFEIVNLCSVCPKEVCIRLCH